MQKDSERRDAGLGSPPRSLLLATDLSCRCDRALDRAVMLASAWGAKLHVLYVLEGNEPEQGPEPVPGGSVRALAERHLRAATRNHDVEAEIVIERGDPAEIILRTANELDCELIVTGIFRYTDTWPLGIHLVASGKVDLDALVTSTYGLDDAATALDRAGAPEEMKVVIRPGQ